MPRPLRIALAACASAATANAAVLEVPLRGASGAVIGAATLTEAPHGVLIRIEAGGLAPGWHGVHLHEKADCSKADFTSAGGHVHGGGARVHGLLNPAANEAGDLPNIFVHRRGRVAAEMFTSATSLAALRDADGSALVIHAGPDDHLTQPIGGAGARVACGEAR